MKHIMLITLLALAACSGNKDTGDAPINPASEIAIIPPESHIPVAPPQFYNPKGINDNVLINGRVPDKSEFQAVIWIGNCTATLVGPRMVYTAAHCVGNRGIQFTVDSKSYQGECRIAREYSGNSTADYALCYVSEDVAGVNYWETINQDADHVREGTEVLLSGFGCRVWGGGIDGKYRVGESKVRRIPSGTNNDIVTVNNATLCSGDSGGPAWSIDKDGKRMRMISVNSRSNTTTTSYLSALHTDTGKRFTGAVLDLYPDAKICGTSREPSNCLNAGPGQPDPEPDPNHFHVDHPIVTIFGLMKPGKESLLDAVRKAVVDAVEAIE